MIAIYSTQYTVIYSVKWIFNSITLLGLRNSFKKAMPDAFSSFRVTFQDTFYYIWKHSDGPVGLTNSLSLYLTIWCTDFDMLLNKGRKNLLI